MTFAVKKKLALALVLTAAVVFSASAGAAGPRELTAERKDATVYTKKNNEAVYKQLDFFDEQEQIFARRGLIAAPEALEITDAQGRVIWSVKAFAFMEGMDAPATANPSLWRHTQLNRNYGLFKVADGIYQVRGYDISNITFIEGNTGWIVFDPLSNVETSQAALALVNEKLGVRPVKGIVISHSHADHYNGIKGVVSEQYVKANSIPIIVPVGFEQNAVSENIYAGNAMRRRADFMYGKHLAIGEKGRLAVGIGLGLPDGSTSYIEPNDIITQTGDKRTIDGVTMEFQLTPGTEAPAEMNTWLPAKKALWMAENCTGTLHNVYTLRGAQVRDSNAWAKYIMEAVTLYGEAEVVFQAHNWPHWGNGIVRKYLTDNAAIYKFINDQTLLYINQGYTANEIAEMLKLPERLEQVWYTRQYYGALAHNAKAVYQRYMGWYDANPARLNPLAPAEQARKTVAYMGGAEKLLKKARADFEQGEYRWVAEVTMTLVFAQPQNKEARRLCADALEQLGYQAESGIWRAAYLTGAQELREGTPKEGGTCATGSGDMLKTLEPSMFFDYMGIHLDTNAAQHLNFKINFQVTDEDIYLVTVKSGVLLYQKGASAQDADVAINLPKQALTLLLTPNWADSEQIKITGDKTVIYELNKYMVAFDRYFNIIEP